MNKKNIVIISLFIMLCVCGCGNNNEYTENLNEDIEYTENLNKNEIKNPFVIGDEKGYANDNYWYYIDGTITNTLSIDFTYAEIQYVLYDSNGAIVNTCFTNINFLEANGIWKYSVHCPMPSGNAREVATFKMHEYKYNY